MAFSCSATIRSLAFNAHLFEAKNRKTVVGNCIIQKECKSFLRGTNHNYMFRLYCSPLDFSNIGSNLKIRNELEPQSTGFPDDKTELILQEKPKIPSEESKKVDESKFHQGNANSEAAFGFGGSGSFPPNGNGGGGGGGDDGDHGKKDDREESEFGPLLKFEEVIKEAELRRVSLPSDMVEAARSIGIPKLLLERYFDLQASDWPIGFLMKYCALFRNRMLADPTFLFKVGTEVVIDTCCATFAEFQKRGKDFWAEFELYTADLLVGLVVNVVLVGLLAPYARIGKPSISEGIWGRMQHMYGSLPSSVFEAERPGCTFSIQQRIATYFYKGLLYGFVGFGCGLIGQGIANLIMTAKRSVKKSEEDIPVPPLFKSAVLWGVFLAVSSNTRYQVINGLERLVEASPIGKRVPTVALAFTVGVRLGNNIYGGMQFVDWARWSEVQ